MQLAPVTLSRITTAADPLYPGLLTLYHDAFPPAERRDINRLTEMLDSGEIEFSAILAGKEPAGLAVTWDFGTFTYVEHLAVITGMQGQGIGKKVLAYLKQRDKPLLLEVEIPMDAEGQKREGFYQSAGFSPLPWDYRQPPYRHGDEVPPMRLWSDLPVWPGQSLDAAIVLFHWKVYNYR